MSYRVFPEHFEPCLRPVRPTRYNENARLLSLRAALNTAQQPPKGFEEATNIHELMRALGGGGRRLRHEVLGCENEEEYHYLFIY